MLAQVLQYPHRSHKENSIGPVSDHLWGFLVQDILWDPFVEDILWALLVDDIFCVLVIRIFSVPSYAVIYGCVCLFF